MTSGEPSQPVSLLALFADEASAHFSGLRSGVARLGSVSAGESAAILESLRHDAHGIVGSAWAVGLDPVAELMRAVEVACVGLARAGADPPPGLAVAVGDAVDAAEALVGAAVAGDGQRVDADVEALAGAVAAAAATGT